MLDTLYRIQLDTEAHQEELERNNGRQARIRSRQGSSSDENQPPMVKQYLGFKTEDVYVIGKAGHFRAGEPAKVVDFVWLTPENKERRLCVHVLFNDGAEDFFVYDLMEMDIFSESDIEQGLHIAPNR